MFKNIFPVYYHVVKRDASMFFQENVVSWACFKESELNSIFHWRFHWNIECFCVILVSQTTEKRDVSSVKSWMFEFKPLGKSFIYTKNKCVRIEPCRTPALTCDQYDDCPLRATLWCRLLKKECINSEYFPISPIVSVYTLALHINLSNALDKSRNLLLIVIDLY